jgi:hypothetical protein
MRLVASITRWATPIALVLASIALAGCASKWRTYCEEKAQCSGGNDKDIDACVAEHDAERDVAAAYDCADPYDKYQECKEKTGHCKERSYTSDCGTEDDAVESCVKAASARK